MVFTIFFIERYVGTKMKRIKIYSTGFLISIILVDLLFSSLLITLLIMQGLRSSDILIYLALLIIITSLSVLIYITANAYLIIDYDNKYLAIRLFNKKRNHICRFADVSKIILEKDENIKSFEKVVIYLNNNEKFIQSFSYLSLFKKKRRRELQKIVKEVEKLLKNETI